MMANIPTMRLSRRNYTLRSPRVEDIPSLGQRDKGLKQSIEQIQSTVREMEKVMRGMGQDGTAQTLANGMRVNYNFIRPHMRLNGKTPAQTAGLDLRLEEVRWKALIKQAIARQTGG